MLKQPTLINSLAKKAQDKINTYIPEKVHAAITTAIKQLFQAVLFGAEFTSLRKSSNETLEEKEMVIKERINFYRKTAAAEGGITGAGGILLGLADFPILIGIKIKLLFEIATHYGFDTKNYKERLFILHVFQLAFSSHQTRKKVFLGMADWDKKAALLPNSLDEFEWRSFQQEYRDYIDLAKLAQLIPIMGAPVGLVVNYNLLQKLGKTAMFAYRMRLLRRKLPGS